MNLAPAMPLTEPYWHPQAGESDVEWQAFWAYVTDCKRSLPLVSAERGIPLAGLEHTAVRWSWHLRTRAWDASVADRAWSEQVETAKRALAQAIQLRAEIAISLLQTAKNEAAKWAKKSEGSPLEVWTSLDLNRAEAMSRHLLADILDETAAPASPNATPVDYSRLSNEELRLLMQLRRKAKGQAA